MQRVGLETTRVDLVQAGPPLEGDSRVEIHGPGYSKVILGEDCVDEWEKYLDVMVASIVAMPAVGRLVVPEASAHCSLDGQNYGMSLAVANQGHGIACNTHVVE